MKFDVSIILSAVKQFQSKARATLTNHYKVLPSSSDRYVMYAANAGLANRMKLHLVAHMVSLVYNRRVALYWEKNSHCAADMSDLFVFTSERFKAPAWPQELRFPGIKCNIQKLEDITTYSNIIFLDMRWQWITNKQLRFLLDHYHITASEVFIPLQEIENEVRDQINTWDEWTCGVHVRRGDFEELGWIIGCERYIEAMKNLLSRDERSWTFFISSDASQEELQIFSDSFGERVIFNSPSERGSSSGVRRALCDLLSLSRTKYLILTPRSSFGEMASILGQVPHEFV